MAKSASPTKQALEGVLDDVGSLVEEALDPSLTREEVIEKLQEIDDLLNGEDEDGDSDSDTDDDFPD